MQQTQNHQKQEVELDLKRLVKALWKQKILIAAVTAICCLCGYLFSALFLTPVYEASVTAYINNRVDLNYSGITSAGDISASLGLSGVCQKVIVSRSVLSEVAENTPYGLTYEDLSRMINVSMMAESPVVRIKVSATDPQMASDVVNAVAEAAPFHMARVIQGCNLVIIDQAVPSNEKVWPNNPGNGILAGFLGCLFCCVLVVCLDLIRDKVDSHEELERRYDLPIIGDIPSLEAAERGDNLYMTKKKGGHR